MADQGRQQPANLAGVTRDLQRLRQQLRDLEVDMAALQASIDAGVTPGAHASSHLPGGTDALTTAAAGTITPGDSASAGSAASFAKSDHRHAIAGFGTTAGTFCQGNDSRLSDSRAPNGSAGGDLTGTYPNPTVAKLRGTNVSTTAPSTGQVLAYDGTDWKPAMAGKAGGTSVWSPGVPPASPSAYDDECNGNSLSGVWTDWDHGAYQTVAQDTSRKLLTVSGTGNGTVRWGGLYQAIPDSEYTIYCMTGMLRQHTGTAVDGSGLALLQGTTNTSDLFVLFRRSANSAATLGVTASKYDAYNGTATSTTTQNDIFPYLRMRCDGTTIWTEAGPDGLSWRPVATTTIATLGWTPTHMALAVTISQATAAMALFSFFRYFGGTGMSAFDATWIGGRF